MVVCKAIRKRASQSNEVFNAAWSVNGLPKTKANVGRECSSKNYLIEWRDLSIGSRSCENVYGGKNGRIFFFLWRGGTPLAA